MTARRFVDTNVWVYAVDDGDPDKQGRARRVLQPTPDAELVVSAQVLGEFYVTVTRKLAVPLPPAEASALVDRMSELPVVAIDATLIATAIDRCSGGQLSYWDALIVAAAEASGCDTIVSEDLAAGTTYGSVRIESPFAV